MKKLFCVLAWVIFALVLVAGCCNNPGGAAQAQQYLKLLQQTYYTASGTLKPQIKEMGQYDNYVALGATLADQGLALAGALQGQYCANKADMAALEAKTQAAVAVAPKVPPTSAPAPSP